MNYCCYKSGIGDVKVLTGLPGTGKPAGSGTGGVGGKERWGYGWNAC